MRCVVGAYERRRLFGKEGTRLEQIIYFKIHPNMWLSEVRPTLYRGGSCRLSDKAANSLVCSCELHEAVPWHLKAAGSRKVACSHQGGVTQ